MAASQRTPQPAQTEDVLRKAARQAGQAGPSMNGAAFAAPPNLRAASAGQLQHLQRTIGNSALQRLIAPTAIEAEAVHGATCACPHCKPQRVYTDEPLAPAIQRDADAHARGCTCPACASGIATAPMIQREWSSEDAEDELESEQSGGWAEQTEEPAGDNAGDDASGAGGETGGGAGGESEGGESGGDGQLMTVHEDHVPDETDAQPDIGLHVAVVEGGAGEAGEQEAEEPAVAAPTTRFVDSGRIGTAPVRVSSQAPEDGLPHAFVDGGRSGSVVWAGGGGAGPRGEQATGSIQSTTNPDYDSRSNGLFSDSEAWVEAGTGDLTVRRSWLGANGGDQGNGHFVTDAAAARFNSHEVLHVNSTKSIYDARLQPMLNRVIAHRADNPAHTTVHGALQLSAIWNLRSEIDWSTAVSNFQTDDTAANAPMKTVDTNDLATGTYPVDRGPGNVAGKAYQHRVTLPSEPAPAPGPAPTPPGPGPAPGPGPGPGPGPAPTPGPTTGVITASALRIREAPNLTAAVLGQYPRDTQIQILSQEEGTPVNGNRMWDKTDRGYVSDAYVRHGAP